MNKLTEIARCANSEVLNLLYDRSGFDNWWDNIPQSCRNEIRKSVQTIIKNAVRQAFKEGTNIQFEAAKKAYKEQANDQDI